MYHLVKNRYIFLGISLLVIIPGIISLAFRGLNVGIDFVGGSTLSLRPQTTISSVTNVTNVLASQNLKDLQITLNIDDNLKSKPTLWVRLNTTIDGDVQAAMKKDLQGKYPNVNVSYDDMPVNGKIVTVATVTGFANNVTPNPSDVQTLLKGLPKTTDTTGKPATTPTAVANTTPTTTANGTATATPKATATATPKATATPTATAKGTATPTAKGTATPVATATPTPTTSQGTIPVSVTDVRVGTGTQTISILTATPLNADQRLAIQGAFTSANNNYVQVLESATTQGSVATTTRLFAVLAVLAASFLILLYVWFAFRKVAKPWRYGACAIIALLHDVLVILGISSILGWLIGFQVDSLFITALLTVVGFSVHDTIVVFDRIRENMQHRTSETFEQVVNTSLVQTLARSLNTSLTVLFTLAALTLFGGVSIRSFTGTLLLGIFSGTYSSIFNASMLLVIWENGELGLNRLRRNRRLPDGREVRDLARTRS